MARNHAQSRGLSAARRPEQAAIGAGFDAKMDTIDSERVAKLLGKSNKLKRCALHALADLDWHCLPANA
jgi:hypothetical protein